MRRFSNILRSFSLLSIACTTPPLHAQQSPQVAMRHVGGLSSFADLQSTRQKLTQKAQPWYETFQTLRHNAHDAPSYRPHPTDTLIRGTAPGHAKENYAALFNDAAAAYALALDWRLTGETARGAAAARILNAWAHHLHHINGTSDRYLAAGLYGYQLAIAAETLRDFPAWSQADQHVLKDRFLHVFVPMNKAFLTTHNHANIDHYWANWDLATLNALMAIGIYTDHPDLYHLAKEYFLHGQGNGALPHAAWKRYPQKSLAQWQESGRDQGHTLLGIGLAGTLCQMAWLQGDDLFSADHHRLLDAARYVARYNNGASVPYTPYHNSDVTQPEIASQGRGLLRPIWALYEGHYARLLHQNIPEITTIYAHNPLEGGGGNYGPNSGGFDLLGYGSLLFLTPHPLEK